MPGSRFRRTVTLATPPTDSLVHTKATEFGARSARGRLRHADGAARPNHRSRRRRPGADRVRSGVPLIPSDQPKQLHGRRGRAMRTRSAIAGSGRGGWSGHPRSTTTSSLSGRRATLDTQGLPRRPPHLRRSPAGSPVRSGDPGQLPQRRGIRAESPQPPCRQRAPRIAEAAKPSTTRACAGRQVLQFDYRSRAVAVSAEPSRPGHLRVLGGSLRAAAARGI
jgi:hypothetical protein